MSARSDDRGEAPPARDRPADVPREPGGPGTAGEPPEGEPLPSLPARALAVFLAPGDLFRRLRAEPAWIGVLAVVVVLTVASVFLTPQEVLEQAFRSQMGSEATEADVERALGVARPLSYVSAVLGPLLTTVALAGFLYFVYTLVLGGEGGFRPLFSVSAHAMLIPTLGGLALLPLMVATGDPEVRLALHLLVPGLDPDSYAYALLRGLNVFGLWTAAVLGIGVAAVYRRASAAAPVAFLVAAYVSVKAVVAVLMT